MDWERYEACLKAQRPQVLREALRVYEEELKRELIDNTDLNGAAEMGYFSEHLAVTQRWREELASQEPQV